MIRDLQGFMKLNRFQAPLVPSAPLLHLSPKTRRRCLFAERVTPPATSFQLEPAGRETQAEGEEVRPRPRFLLRSHSCRTAAMGAGCPRCSPPLPPHPSLPPPCSAAEQLLPREPLRPRAVSGGAGKGAGPRGAGPGGRGRGARRGGAGAVGPPRRPAAMEQAPPDAPRQLQPAPLEPLGLPDAGLQAAAGEEEEGAREEGPADGTMTENNFWLKKIEISVSEAEKRTGRNAMNMQETYTAYLIETRSVDHTDGQSVLTDSLWRRYSEFELLRNYLLVYYPHVVVPPLPEKRAEFVWHKLSADNMDPDFVERRRIGLENFLLRVASHPILCRDKIFYLFLTQEGNWKETVNETGFQLKADSRLKALNATFRVKNPDKRFTELKHYSDELQSVISHLLRVRARVADRLYGVYKVHGNYGRVFSEWSAIEKEMGDGLQSAGHHMDVYASSIDDILEDEEHYADQLKEYLFYAEALRAVCRKHELMQYDLEMAAQDLASKKQQCEELATGTVRTFSLKGMTTKLFGQETPEQREARIKVLEEQINEGEQQLKSKNLEGREFVKNAWADIERFKEQKNHDLKEALISYAVMQISMCKKGIQVWTNAKECFSKM
uniref:Sorting nexin-4 n=6 Tax=Carnivora TaxID=33554 RepID=A0A8C0TT46_CANLF